MTFPLPTFQSGEAIRAADLNLIVAALRQIMAGGEASGGQDRFTAAAAGLRAGPSGGPGSGWYAGRVVLGRILTASVGTPALRSAITYTARAFGRGEEFASGVAPGIDPFMPGTVITPAAEGDPCLIVFDPQSAGDTQAKIWAITERPAAHGVFPVLVTQTGGSAGDEASACTFTYSVTDLEGTNLGTGLTPARPRPTLGKMKAPSAGSYGLGFYNEDGDFTLYDPGEVPDPEVCA